MPLNNFPIDVVGITIEADPTALKMASNLSDLLNTGTARANLSVYSQATSDATYAPLASPSLTGNVTITTNSASPALIIVQDGAGDVVQFKDVAADTTYSFINASGKVNTIASASANAGFSIAHGVAPTSPVNGDIWTTTAGIFVRLNGATIQLTTVAALASYLTTSAAASTYLTAASATTTYLSLAGGTLTGTLTMSGTSNSITVEQINGQLNEDFIISAYNDTGMGTWYNHTFKNSDGRFLLATNGGGLTFPDATTQTTAAMTQATTDTLYYSITNPSNFTSTSADVLIANAIASNINFITGSTGTWVGNGLPSIAGLIGWGIYNPTDGLIAYTSSTGSSFSLASAISTPNNTVQVNGSNSSFYVA